MLITISTTNLIHSKKMCYVLKNESAKSIQSNIGLMYLHDYYFSVQKGGLDCNIFSNNEEKCKLSWLYNNNNEWLMTERSFVSDSGNYTYYAIMSTITGLVSSRLCALNHNYRPVFYINSNLKIIKGNGSLNNPFIINFE